MRILITGAAGFIGSHLAERYLASGHSVVGVDNLLTGRRENVPDIEFFEADIRDFVPSGRWDLVFHCAASYHDRSEWERDASTNVVGTINVVREAMRSDAKLVYFQTALCYGLDPVSPVTLDAPLNPVGTYAISKTAGESYIRDSGVEFASLRLANIYGPRNVSGPGAAIYRRLKDGRAPVIVDTRRDFIYIDDLLSAAELVAASGTGFYHVSTGRDYAIADIYHAEVAAMDLDLPKPEITPKPPGDAATILLDPSRIRDEFGWSAQVGLSEGIRHAVRWYDEHGVTEAYTHLAGAK